MGIAGSRRSAGIVLKHCTIWKADRSPACRSVLMTIDAMNLCVREVDVDMDKDEHKSPDLIAMNYHQTLPILRDRELVLTDSHAINTYLATRYAGTIFRRGALLPREFGSRARVEQMLHYNNGIIQPKYRSAANPILYDGCKHVMPQQVCDIEVTYSDLDNLLGHRKWFGGSWPNLADITLAASLSTLNVLVPMDPKRYPKLSAWLFRISNEPFYLTGNAYGLKEFTKRIGRTEELDESCNIVDIKFPRSSSKRRSVLRAEQTFKKPKDKEQLKDRKS